MTTDIERALYGRPRCVWRPETDCLPECEYGIRGPCVAEEHTIMTLKTEDEDLARLETAMAMTRKITAMVDTLLDPLEKAMRGWAPEYQSILWEAVMIEARQRMEETLST